MRFREFTNKELAMFHVALIRLTEVIERADIDDNTASDLLRELEDHLSVRMAAKQEVAGKEGE